MADVNDKVDSLLEVLADLVSERESFKKKKGEQKKSAWSQSVRPSDGLITSIPSHQHSLP